MNEEVRVGYAVNSGRVAVQRMTTKLFSAPPMGRNMDHILTCKNILQNYQYLQ